MNTSVSRFTRLLTGLGMAAVALTTLLPVTATQAADGKDYPAYMCAPYSVPAGFFPYPGPDGSIYNNQNFTVYFVCPGIRDEPGGISSAVMRVSTYLKGTNVTCTLYSYSPAGSYLYQSRTAANMTGKRNINFGPIGGYANGVYSIICGIPSGGTLISYTINEN